jgi:hypothetical protein
LRPGWDSLETPLALVPLWLHNATMASITLKDIPPELHARLRSAAEETGRSLNKYVLAVLERAVAARKADRRELSQRIATRRAAMPLILDDRGIAEAIDEHRE